MTELPPESYIADPNLVVAAEVADHLNQPLLLTGEPGTGKTQFARYWANRLGLDEPLRFDTKSTSQARDLLYQFDGLARFHAAQLKQVVEDNLQYISFQALGLAFLYSQPTEYARPFLGERVHKDMRRSIVLVDEIDKAPRDFPNDLLNEFGEKYFVIPELNGRRVEANADRAYAPMIVLTSNVERNLPDAFLRRCVFYHIPFPKPDDMKRIVETHLDLEGTGIKGGLVDSALDYFYEAREQDTEKKPATAELVAWVKVLMARGAKADRPLQASRSIVRGTLGILGKKKDDVELLRRLAVKTLGAMPDADY